VVSRADADRRADRLLASATACARALLGAGPCARAARRLRGPDRPRAAGRRAQPRVAGCVGGAREAAAAPGARWGAPATGMSDQVTELNARARGWLRHLWEKATTPD